MDFYFLRIYLRPWRFCCSRSIACCLRWASSRRAMKPDFFLGLRALSAIIVAQAGGIVVEDKKEHHRHQIHHPLHARHPRRRLVLHVDARIDDVGHRHQEAEETDMVAESA